MLSEKTLDNLRSGGNAADDAMGEGLPSLPAFGLDIGEMLTDV